MKRLILDQDKCIGCLLCELTCALVKKKNIDPKNAMIVIREGKEERSINVCVQCNQKVCKEVCLPDAISVSSIGATVVDEKKCDGCEKCIGACVNRAIKIEKKLAKICDICQGEPECVAICPTAALRYQELDDFRKCQITATGKRLVKAMRRK